MNVCDNLTDHMIGNVYVKYFREEDALKAKEALTGRYFARTCPLRLFARAISRML